MRSAYETRIFHGFDAQGGTTYILRACVKNHATFLGTDVFKITPKLFCSCPSGELTPRADWHLTLFLRASSICEFDEGVEILKGVGRYSFSFRADSDFLRLCLWQIDLSVAPVTANTISQNHSVAIKRRRLVLLTDTTPRVAWNRRQGKCRRILKSKMKISQSPMSEIKRELADLWHYRLLTKLPLCLILRQRCFRILWLLSFWAMPRFKPMPAAPRVRHFPSPVLEPVLGIKHVKNGFTYDGINKKFNTY